jgi:SEA/GATOR complex protein SEA3/WDR59
MDLKKRMCTLGLQGPWGESSSVFIRITFIFPREYPRSVAPQSLPHIDLERNHLIPIKNRAFLLRELRNLRKKPPCLEACLRFLLGLPNKRGIAGRSVDTDSGSSSEDKGDATRSGRDPSVSMRGQAGLAEPRTSQGVFGLNGNQHGTSLIIPIE